MKFGRDVGTANPHAYGDYVKFKVGLGHTQTKNMKFSFTKSRVGPTIQFSLLVIEYY